jgi:hypothetical protein
MYWVMVLVRVKVTEGDRSGIIEYLTSQKGGFFVFKAVNTHKHMMDLTHDKSEGLSKRGGSKGLSPS